MKHIKKFQDFVNEGNQSELVNEGNNSMTINDFSYAFTEFYDFITESSKFMDADTIKHIKEAVKHLDKAWENEADAHGVDYENYSIKYGTRKR